jgi:hypothetical protein
MRAKLFDVKKLSKKNSDAEIVKDLETSEFGKISL